jgi:hypothetical protein
MGPPAPPVFTLAPALANTATYLDLTSSSEARHFKGATKPLNAQPFNFADPSDLQILFLDLVLKKSQVWGWNTIFTIPLLDAVTALTAQRVWPDFAQIRQDSGYGILCNFLKASAGFLYGMPMRPILSFS